MDLKEALQSRLHGVHAQRDALVQQWSPYINAVGAYVKENQNRDLTSYDKRNMAISS